MQYQEGIQLSTDCINAIIGSDDGRLDSIITELDKHIKAISSLLTSYHWSEKGMVHGVKIDPASVQIDQNGKGQFLVKYGTNIHYGCSDMDIELDNKMVVNITVDLLTGGAVLTGEYIPEREPDGF